MNGKMAKMLRKMHRADPRSKRLFKSLDWQTRTKIRKLYRENDKLVHVDQLAAVTGVKMMDLYPHTGQQ